MITYLACPYTDADPVVRQARVDAASLVAANMMSRDGLVVFSPITHGHAVDAYLPRRLSASHEFWMGQCLPVLSACSSLVILPLPGWRDSRGLAVEVAWAVAADIAIMIFQSEEELAPGIRAERVTAEEFKTLFPITTLTQEATLQ